MKLKPKFKVGQEVTLMASYEHPFNECVFLVAEVIIGAAVVRYNIRITDDDGIVVTLERIREEFLALAGS